jgi:hypothetical protein
MADQRDLPERLEQEMDDGAGRRLVEFGKEEGQR